MNGTLKHRQADDLRFALLRDGLLAADGTPVELPETFRKALSQLLDVLEKSPDAVVLPADDTLTTGQVADMLGVSRSTVTRLVDKGELETSGPSVHRRITAAEVQRYQQHRQRVRRQAVRSLAQDIGPETPPDRAVRTR